MFTCRLNNIEMAWRGTGSRNEILLGKLSPLRGSYFKKILETYVPAALTPNQSTSFSGAWRKSVIGPVVNLGRVVEVSRAVSIGAVSVSN